MKLNKVQFYGEYVDIAAPTNVVATEENKVILTGEIWYN